MGKEHHYLGFHGENKKYSPVGGGPIFHHGRSYC